MGNRCVDCNKFVSLDTDEPEELELVVSHDGTIHLEVRLARLCAECGTEMKETRFELEEEIPADWVEAHLWDDALDNGHGDWFIELEGLTSTESGGGRYKKNMIGFETTAVVKCRCGETHEVLMSDSVSASFFDEV